MRNLLNDVVCYGAVWMCVALILLGFVENELAKRKAEKEKKKAELRKLKAEIYAQRKREAFEKYRREVEEFKLKSEEMSSEEVQESNNVINFVEGVQRLRDNGHKYVPYDRPNPLNDIRGSLSEFTVNDVLNTFYF